MAEISKEIIGHIASLAKLHLTDEEKRRSEKDMKRMIAYIDKLNEPDTSGTEPAAHINGMQNVFREDEVTNEDGREALLSGAPEREGDYLKVPKTV